MPALFRRSAEARFAFETTSSCHVQSKPILGGALKNKKLEEQNIFTFFKIYIPPYSHDMKII